MLVRIGRWWGSSHSAGTNTIHSQGYQTGDGQVILSFTATSLRIIQPNDKDEIPLTANNFTSTSPISFQAQPLTASGAAQWMAQLDYMTSGGRGPFQDIRRFTTDSATPTHNETYVGLGGKLSIEATDNVSGTSAHPVTAYLIGVSIPDADITAQLVNLYTGGATSNLMTGIAERESSYTQFVKRPLFGISALWPTESFDGGSHVGLMQLQLVNRDLTVNIAYAWNWLSNTATGVSLFANSKLLAATRLTSRVIASHPGLRQLNPVELEHVALILYGPYASPNLSEQYYAPVPAPNGGWSWAVNTPGNPNGVAYANYIFKNLR